ncbi:unnamed protein product [Diatraea saccharalis]|uniref:THAP-type domain-containing protein n=1 Tax=Diatraea saccharalis TaxID=40085 RepID=A0A9N9R007_9NEOP|nr:unnamed protein product [Diatraea saccharalis]
MGGCRCSYRNCTVKSDKKTHMFHFPVYEKLRCYQWIINAHRYDYLHLTVSQLRNRVICQNHFKDEYFMNYMKEKLTFEAVPTEDGPYCDPSKEEKIDSEIIEKANLVINDIEQKLKYIDKKANSSLKYIDFLLTVGPTMGGNGNTELRIDIPKFNPKKDEVITTSPLLQLKRLKDSSTDFKNRNITDVIKKPFLHSSNVSTKQTEDHSHNNIMTTQTFLNKKLMENNIKDLNSMNLNPNDTIFNNNVTNEITNIFNSPVALTAPIPSKSINKADDVQQSVIIDTLNNVQNTDYNSVNNNYFSDKLQFQSSSNNTIFDQPLNAVQSCHHTKTQKNMKIKILSEETILNPLPFVGKLEPIFPSLVLPVPNRLKGHTSSDLQISQHNYNTHNRHIGPDLVNKTEILVTEQKPNINENESSEVLKNNDVIISDPPKIEIIEPEAYTTTPKKTNMVSNEKVSTPKSLLKSKVSPERLAAIEKKRMFNKKLRDMVESCLEKSNGPEKDMGKGNILKRKDNENIDTSISKSNSLTSSQDYIVTYLEARMKKMENVLLNKIEQNSNRISELKKCVVHSKQKSLSTQTSTSEESHKLYLYEEISKFLSPDAKNLVYEDLFIYKYSQSQTDNVPKAKRKRYR